MKNISNFEAGAGKGTRQFSNPLLKNTQTDVNDNMYNKFALSYRFWEIRQVCNSLTSPLSKNDMQYQV